MSYNLCKLLGRMAAGPSSIPASCILLCSLALSLHVIAYGSGIDDIAARHDAHAWHIGDGIGPGDFFVYEICGASHPGTGSCHTVQLDFYAELLSPFGKTWVVQAEITDSEVVQHHIFLVDSDTFDISTGHLGRKYANSLEDTVFYLARFASAHDPKRTEIGTVWGEVPTTLNRAWLSVTAEDAVRLEDGRRIDVAVLEYWAFKPSTFTVSDDIGLPVSAAVYGPYPVLDDPPLDFEFELVDFSARGVKPHEDPDSQLRPSS